MLCFQKVSVFIKINFEVFWDFWVFCVLITELYKFLEPKRRFIFKVYLDVRDGFSGPKLTQTMKTPLYVRKNTGHILDEFKAEADKTGIKTGMFASGFSGIRRRFQIAV
jgi:hypothetical protein